MAGRSPAFAGLTALTSAPRPLVQTGSCRRCPILTSYMSWSTNCAESGAFRWPLTHRVGRDGPDLERQAGVRPTWPPGGHPVRPEAAPAPGRAIGASSGGRSSRMAVGVSSAILPQSWSPRLAASCTGGGEVVGCGAERDDRTATTAATTPPRPKRVEREPLWHRIGILANGILRQGDVDVRR